MKRSMTATPLVPGAGVGQPLHQAPALGADQVVEVDRAPGEVGHREPQQHARPERREVHLHPARDPRVLGLDRAVVDAGDERPEPGRPARRPVNRAHR